VRSDSTPELKISAISAGSYVCWFSTHAHAAFVIHIPSNMNISLQLNLYGVLVLVVYIVYLPTCLRI
jgi:hypothetical protein